MSNDTTRVTSFNCLTRFMNNAEGDMALRQVLIGVPHIDNRGKLFNTVMELIVDGGLEVFVEDGPDGGRIVGLQIGKVT